ncbi:putative poly(glycerol-phosphate) alpha-glucosyltransferase [Crateriforma conspicua]|uniref:Putative poly(Glycerol-phosphate) alpha-glucosyltransferase n=1 Tax=Crateriforma conspicua TaxID=2527996 RepID=A0A5C6FMM6_9PLAN|nr:MULTISPECIES: glycosyltransferase family 4 protein [Crateriforma]TWU63385.1 putative poly(glycerol-phosphate) alpha-glucosyltransferase [Crateriforma conspicua]
MSRLKILAVIPHLIRPSEVWMYRQLQVFRHQDLHIIAGHRHRHEQFDLTGIPITTVPESMNSPLRGLRRHWDRIRFPGMQGTRYGQHQRQWFREQVCRIRPDAIHCQYGTVGLSTLDAVAGLNIPVFVQFNGDGLSCLVHRRRGRERMVRSIGNFAGLITVARYQQQWLLRRGATPEHVALIPYGAPLEPDATSIRPQRSNCQFLAVGRLCEMKSPLNLIRAFALCQSLHPASRLTIIGDGPMRGETENLIQRLGLKDHVTLQGVQPAEVVRRQMLQADVFVQHSVTAANGMMEGWPVAIGEAMSRGLPVVATRHAGICEQVTQDVNGYLCDEFDWSDMGRCMADLAGNAMKRQTFGRQALRLSLDARVQTHTQLDFIRKRLGVSRQSQRPSTLQQAA